MRKKSYSICLNFGLHEKFTEPATYFKFRCVLYANVPIICHLLLKTQLQLHISAPIESSTGFQYFA
jgi:hypothetical protein